MEKYKIIISDEAFNDIINVSNYIFIVSVDNKVSSDIYDLLMASSYSLNFLPYRYQISFDNIRKLTVKSYSIFYSISEDTKEVIIIRVLGTSMNYSQMFNKNDF